MNEIEEKLWNYIDGFCTEEERKAISYLIQKDENYRKMYAELLALQESITAINLEEPSMGFTFKVMENIRTEQARVPLKTHINNSVIYVIVAFFMGTILLLLGYVFANANWTAADPVQLPKINLPAASTYLNPTVVKGFLFFDVILGLFFLDHYFRKWFFEKK
jgi:VIT1/CCC1 family predicted Fe2+/Mn2+ transporter